MFNSIDFKLFALLWLVCLGSASVSFAQVTNPSASSELTVSIYFGEGSVWQRDRPVQLRGGAQPGARIVFASERFGESLAVADSSGSWTIALDAMTAGGPFAYTLRAGKQSLTVRDVYVGDVFVCSGQSNMAWPLDQTLNGVSAAAQTDPLLRHVRLPNIAAATPNPEPGTAMWQSAAPGRSEGFTAVGYYFAQVLREARPDIAIGLINVSWGGSSIQAWLPEAAAELLDDDRSAANRIVWDRLRRDYPQAFTAQGRQLRPGDVTGTPFEMGAPWEARGWPDINGCMWFDRYVDLSSRQIGDSLTLNLGTIDDSDSTFLNGVLVGTMLQKYNVTRRYRVPGNLLIAGRNTLSVRVEDSGGGGGLTGPKDSLYLVTNAGRIRLGDNWRVRPDQLSYDSLPPANQTPRALYNGMLHSLDGVAARGALWYQGESNAGSDADASAYAQQLQSLVGVIRQLTGDTLLPFVAVELPEHLPASSDPIEANGSWARLRQSTRAVSSMPQASSVVTFGYGNPGDIHPREKRPIGKMLAVEMERLAFGKTSGPRFPVATELTQTGQMLTVRFEHVGTGLRAEDDQPLRGFAVRDTSGAWHFAQAEVIGKDRIRIVGPVGLSIDSVAYAWSNNPVGVNLVNGDQMRAGSFLLTLAE